jgi:hypothetical protein
MKLLLRRDQQQGMLGKVKFTLEVRAELTDQERTNIKKYKLSDTRLYEKRELTGPGVMGSLGIVGVMRLGAHLTAKALNITVDVKDLEHGKRIECNDILEMLAVEQQVREAAETFKIVLDAASHFGGEEVIAL